jgi:hypothetical protein
MVRGLFLADTHFDAVPPTVGVAEDVFAPPHLPSSGEFSSPSATVQSPLKVATPRVKPEDAHGFVLFVYELKSSMVAPKALGGPCTNGGEMYALMPSPAAANTTGVRTLPKAIDTDATSVVANKTVKCCDRRK